MFCELDPGMWTAQGSRALGVAEEKKRAHGGGEWGACAQGRTRKP